MKNAASCWPIFQRTTITTEATTPAPSAFESRSANFIRLLCNFWKNLLLISLDTLVNNLHCLVGLKESQHLARSRLFQVFVELEIVRRFLFPMLAKVFVRRNVIHAFVVGQHTNHFVVDLSPVFKF